MSKAYEKITDYIMAMLEDGVVPWQQPWVTRAPISIRNRRYRGVNALILGLMPYTDPRWLTFREAQRRGGRVRKGERGVPVVFWNWQERENEDGVLARRPFARKNTLFNVEQVDDVEFTALEAVTHEQSSIEAAEAVIAGYRGAPTIEVRGQQAAYLPLKDEIRMPRQDQFASVDGYYSTLFHELGHSTGHDSRLARGIEQQADQHSYGREELIAEFCSAFLCAETGIDPTRREQSAAYIAAWRTTIQADTRLVVQSAAAAQRAADFVLGRFAEDMADDEVAEVGASVAA